MSQNTATHFICITGLPGSGKSYFAQHLANAISAHHINSDRIRSKLGLRNHYDPESKRLVYQQLIQEAREDLLKERTVVLDSTFYKQDVRQPLEDLSKEVGIEIFWVEVRASESVIQQRINKQRPYSQADFSVYKSIKEKYEPLPHVDLVLYSDQWSLEEMLNRAETALGMMTTAAVKELIRRRAFPDSGENAKLVETHASWVVLSDHYAYKIKKPVHFSFMDFSTLERRKYFCERELELNKRLTDGIYLKVLPIYSEEHGARIGRGIGPPIDYCVQLKRLKEFLRMDHLLDGGAVSSQSIERIAIQLVKFHQDTEVIKRPWDLAQAQLDFYDLKKIRPTINREIGRREAELLDRILLQANQFLQRHQDRFQERIDAGFMRDGHGDLHSGNIFLYPEPILFDCIEFNDHFRQIDLMDELAFLCMDLEYHGYPELAKTLLDTYRKRSEIFPSAEDHFLFQYFKAYRANVRLKVTALKNLDHPEKEDLASMRKYLDLLERYTTKLSKD